MVVVEGETVLEVLPKTLPKLLSRERTVEVPVVTQDNVVDPPAVMLAGEAEKEEMVGAITTGGRTTLAKVVKGLSVETAGFWERSLDLTLKW